MTRTHLLGAASAVALACLSNVNAFAAQSTIAGGGSTLAQYDYTAEFSLYNSGTNAKQATFGTYYESGSGAGQSGLLNDDLTCDINKVTGNNGGNCTGGSGVGQPGNTVDYGASDATLSSAQISAWATYPYGQPAAGNLIQLPCHPDAEQQSHRQRHTDPERCRSLRRFLRQDHRFQRPDARQGFRDPGRRSDHHCLS
jgi:hypothetical protein